MGSTCDGLPGSMNFGGRLDVGRGAGTAAVPPCGAATAKVSDPALVNGMSPEPLIPTGVLAVGRNAGHELLAKTVTAATLLAAGSAMAPSVGLVAGVAGCFSGLALLRRGWRHRRAWWRAWHGLAA
jgi:hypothetical protein